MANTDPRSVSRRIRHSTWLLGLLAMLMVVSGLAVMPAVTASAGSFGAIPVGLPIQSRCQGMSVGGHIYFVGQEVVAHTSGGICGAAPTDIEWAWQLGQGSDAKGCKTDDTFCEFKVTTSTDNQYVSLCIDGTNVQGGWTSCDYYGVVGKGEGVLEGYVHDKDGGPVAGAVVKAYGHPGATTTTGADGFYAMTLNSGTYAVDPELGTQGKAATNSFTPRSTSVSVSDGSKAKADFTLDTGVELKLHLDSTSVVADGYHVVNGTITAKQHGQPLAGLKVQLEVDPSGTYDEAVTKGARASICYNGSRIWPSGTLNAPSGVPVDVTTDSSGQYQFSIAVGTTPGTWTLDAWAFNDTGTSLSTDTTNASDTQSITFTINGLNQLSGFVAHLNSEATIDTTFAASLSSAANSANTMVALLSQQTTTAGAAMFGGVSFGMVNAKDGQSMIIFPSGQPPEVNAQGVISPTAAANANDLVYDPAEWSGTGLITKIANNTSIAAVVSGGGLNRLPTLSEFDAGTFVPGWNGVSGNQLTLFQPTFDYLGWPYLSSTPGVCF